MSTRANALADRLERGADALVSLAGELTPAEWRMPLPKDGRSIGVIIHHVASSYPLEISLAEMLGAGKQITGVTKAAVDAGNAEHAKKHDGVGQEETIRLLRQNSAAAATAIRSLSDEQLDSTALISLYEDAPLTCQFMLEAHAVRHSYHHLALIRSHLAVARR